MAKKPSKKDKEAKKARMASKNAKIQSKTEIKHKKIAKKIAEDDNDVDIDEILANYAQQQAAFETITIEVSSPPSKRANATLVASPVHGRRELLLFGGEAQINSLSVFYNDLYVYSVGSDTWRKVSSPNSPMPRSGHAMCVHPSGLVLMFGGEFSSPKQNTFYHYGDCWILDAAEKEWTKVEAKRGPSARSGHRMTYWKNYILLYGGFRDLASSTVYLDDLWAFDVTSHKWHQIEPEAVTKSMNPEARSGHSFLPTAEGAVLWGGYSKVKAAKGLQKGKVHTDCWLLKMKGDLKGVRWERRKKASFAPSPRVGCQMVHHRGRGVLFGGVYDTDETEESLDSIFYNSLHAYQIEANRWYGLSLRTQKKARVVAQAKTKRHEDLAENLERILNKVGLDDEAESVAKGVAEISSQDSPETPGSDSDDDSVTGPVREYPVVMSLPHPRFNAITCVVDDTLFIFSGIWERGDKDYTLDSMYSIDLGKLDGVKVYWENFAELEEDDQDSDEDEDDDDDDDSDDEDEDEPEEEEEVIQEEEEEEEEETEAIPDLRPWLPQPKAFESLRAFYQRTGDEFTSWALSNNKDSRGKDLKRVAFTLAEDRWWERREAVRLTEDQYEELGGVADVIEKEASSGKKRR